MFAFFATAGMMYGATWGVRNVPKVLMAVVPFLYKLAEAKIEVLSPLADIGSMAILGLDMSDVNDIQSGNLRMLMVQYKIEELPEVLQFLAEEKLYLTEKEAFVLDREIKDASVGNSPVLFVVRELVNFSRLRLADKKFMDSTQKA